MENRLLKTIIISLFSLLFATNVVFAVSKEEARRQLEDSNLNYLSIKQFVECAHEKDATTAKLFLDAGMDPNSKFMGIPILLYTIEYKLPEVAKMLIEAGANPNTSFGGETALYIAIYMKQPDVAISLLKKGANPNKGLTYIKGYTPLRVAIRRNQIEVVKLLLEKNADVKNKPLLRPSNIKLAHKKKFKEIEQMLLNNQNNK